MTTEERLNRIEHVTAGIAEERRKDREESRQLWRDTQRQIHELTLKIADTNDTVARLAEESRAADAELREAIRESDARLREAIRETDARLGARIESLVSAIAQFLPAKPAQQ